MHAIKTYSWSRGVALRIVDSESDICERSSWSNVRCDPGERTHWQAELHAYNWGTNWTHVSARDYKRSPPIRKTQGMIQQLNNSVPCLYSWRHLVPITNHTTYGTGTYQFSNAGIPCVVLVSRRDVELLFHFLPTGYTILTDSYKEG